MVSLIITTILDAPISWQVGFQDPGSPIICGIIYFHHHLIYFLLVIGTFVVWLLFRAWSLFQTSKDKKTEESSKFTHSTWLEVVWTITPAFLLAFIAFFIEGLATPTVSLKFAAPTIHWRGASNLAYLGGCSNSMTEFKIVKGTVLNSETVPSFGSLSGGDCI